MKPRRIYHDLSLYQRRSKHARRFAVAIVMPALRLAAAKKNPAPREEIPRSGAG